MSLYHCWFVLRPSIITRQSISFYLPTTMEPTQVHPSSTSEKNTITTTLYLEINDIVPLDFEDPHRAALEDNPQHAEKLTTKTLLAVFVRYNSSLIEDVLNDRGSLSFSASPRPRLVPLRS